MLNEFKFCMFVFSHVVLSPCFLQGSLKCNPLRLVVNQFSLCSFVILCWFGPVLLDPQGSAETQVIRNGQPLIYDILRNFKR